MTLLRAVKETLTLKEIVAPVLPALGQVESRLQEIADEGNGILKESSHYVLSGGGKRLRAALVLFCAAQGKKSGAAVTQEAVDIAAAVELIHAATLVHDDIIDRAVIRRLRPTVGVQFGDDMAVLLGDFLYARAFEMIAGAGSAKITRFIAKTTRDMCEGEIDQLKYRYQANLNHDEYLSFIERKTASLIAACSYSGAVLAEMEESDAEKLRLFGLNIGISYQIVDDLLDIVGSENKMGKTLHTDVHNGKMTLPFILLREKLAGEERENLIKTLRSPLSDWMSLEPLLQKHAIAQETERHSDDYFNAAIQSIRHFPDPFRDNLDKLSRFILKRDF